MPTVDAHTTVRKVPTTRPTTSATHEIWSSPSKPGLGDEVTQPPMVIWRHIAKEADTYQHYGPAGGRGETS